MSIESISAGRDNDGNVVVHIVETGYEGRLGVMPGKTTQLTMSPEEAVVLARHLTTHAQPGKKFILAPPPETPIGDVFNAMVGAFNLMTRGDLTEDNIPSKYAHLFKAAE